jgi:hypothetical protein
VKQVRSEDVPGLFPQAPKIAPGLMLFALHAADGTPIMLTDSREAAIANAWSNELQAVSVPRFDFRRDAIRGFRPRIRRTSRKHQAMIAGPGKARLRCYAAVAGGSASTE